MWYLERPHTLKLAGRGGNLTKYHVDAVDHWQLGANYCTKRVKRPTKVGRLTVTWELASTDLQVNGPHNAPINSNQSVVCSLLQNVVYVSQ